MLRTLQATDDADVRPRQNVLVMISRPLRVIRPTERGVLTTDEGLAPGVALEALVGSSFH
jgi:hypothetical protein